MAKPGLTLAASALRQVLKYSAQPGAMACAETLSSTRRERKISSRAVLVRHSQDTATGAAPGELRIRRLPFTRQEADQILPLVPAGAGLKALDFEANRATARELSDAETAEIREHAGGFLEDFDFKSFV